MRNSIFDPEVQKWSLSDEQKKILTYVKSWDDECFDEAAFRTWYEAKHWKKLGLACPPMYSMLGKLPDGITTPYVPNHSISESPEAIAKRIIIW